jgi:hypothetical protein
VRHSKIRTSMSELGHSPPSHPTALTGYAQSFPKPNMA